MSATYILVTEHDNTPHQLLALQRLADFPARAELREQSAALRAQSAEDLSRLREQTAQIRAERLHITRAREARAQAKAQREAEMHIHKIQMDQIRVFLRNPNRNLNPNLFPDDASFVENQNGGGTSRARSAEQLSVLASESPTSTSRDALTDHDAQVGSVCPSGPSSKSDISNHKSEIRSPLSTLNPQRSTFLSPEVIANTNLYDQKIDAGEIRVIYAPGKHYEIEYCNPADQPALERLHKSAPLRFFEDPTRTHFLPGLRTFGKNPYIPPSAASACSSPSESSDETNSTPQTFPSKTEP